MMDTSDATASASQGYPSTVTIKAVYCPGSSQEEIRRFKFPLPTSASTTTEPGSGDCSGLFEELRRRIGAACSGAGTGEGLSLYYVDADQERVRFSTSEELAQLLRTHASAAASTTSAPPTLRILAEPAVSDTDGAEHPGVRCDGCNQAIRGRRYRCFQCPDYDLCQRCVLRGVHDQHSMLVLHRPGDADSLPPWLCRFGGFGGGGFGRGFGGGRCGPPGAGGSGGYQWQWPGGRHQFPWQQQQQQQVPVPAACGGGGYPRHMMMMQQQQQQPGPPPPLSVACPQLARKLEKARCRFEAKLAKRCERMQHRWALKQQRQQAKQQAKEAGAAAGGAARGTAEEPIRIDIDEQQQQQQQLSPEEAMLLKQLRKRHRQSQSAGGKKHGKKKHGHRHHHHHKRGRGGRKRRRSSSSSSTSSSSSSGSSDESDTSTADSSSDLEDTMKAGCDKAQEKAYRQLLKKFKKMGFKDDDTCWLRELIREKRGNLNEILDAIRQRRQQHQQQQQAQSQGGRDV